MRRLSLFMLMVVVVIAAVVVRVGISRIETITDGMGFHAATDKEAYLAAKTDLCAYLRIEGYKSSERPSWYERTTSEQDSWFVMQPTDTPIFVRIYTTDSSLDAEVSCHRGFSLNVVDDDSANYELQRVKDCVASWFFAWQANNGIPGMPPSSLPDLHQSAFSGSPALPRYVPK